MARHFAQQDRIARFERLKPRLVQLRVSFVLVIDQARDADLDDLACFFRISQKIGGSRIGLLAFGDGVAGAETGEIGADGFALFLDRRDEFLLIDLQDAGRGNRAQHDGIDHRLGAACGFGGVEQDGVLGPGLDNIFQLGRIEPPVAHDDLFVRRIDAVRRGNQRGACLGDEARRDGARGLGQFGRHHQIDFPRRRHQREDRAFVPRLRHLGQNFDIIGRGARALRHTRHGGRLHGIIQPPAGADDPIHQHAAAFAAHGGDQQLNRANVAHDPNSPMMPRRKPATMRSPKPGFCVRSI